MPITAVQAKAQQIVPQLADAPVCAGWRCGARDGTAAWAHVHAERDRGMGVRCISLFLSERDAAQARRIQEQGGGARVLGVQHDIGKVGAGHVVAEEAPLRHVARHVLELHRRVRRLAALHLARVQRLLRQAPPLGEHGGDGLGLRRRELGDALADVAVEVLRYALGEEVVEFVREQRVPRQVRLLHAHRSHLRHCQAHALSLENHDR